MRKLKQIAVVDVEMNPGSVLALDDGGELWFGKLETTDDDRRMIHWTPVNTPRDGAAYSEPQLSRFDKMEQEARERIQRDTEARRKALPVETGGEDGTTRPSPEAEGSPDDDLEDGEGTDPAVGPRSGDDREREGD